MQVILPLWWGMAVWVDTAAHPWPLASSPKPFDAKTSLSCFRPPVRCRQEPVEAPSCTETLESSLVVKLRYSVLSIGGVWAPVNSLHLSDWKCTLIDSFFLLIEGFYYLQALYPATQGTWLPKWPIHTSTSSFLWLFSRDCCNNLTLKRRISVCSEHWTPQMPRSRRFGGSKTLRVNYNYSTKVISTTTCIFRYNFIYLSTFQTQSWYMTQKYDIFNVDTQSCDKQYEIFKRWQ